MSDLPCPRSIFKYVWMLTSLIEGREVSLEEVVEMLLRAMRQHSIPRKRQIDQTVDRLNEHPP